MKKSKMVKLGIVGVDSAKLVICDPLYIETEFKKTEFQDETFSDPSSAGFTTDSIEQITFNENCGGQLNYKLGHAGVAVALRPGFGDGTYEVFAEIVDTGELGLRIKQIIIPFIEDDELEEL